MCELFLFKELYTFSGILQDKHKKCENEKVWPEKLTLSKENVYFCYDTFQGKCVFLLWVNF